MKALVVIGILLLATPAQAGIATGVVGLTRTRVSGTSSGDFSANGEGWFIGGLVDITTSIAQGLETGLFFGKRKLTQTAAVGGVAPATVDADATYLEVPVEYLWRLSRLFFLGGGFYYAHYVGGTYKTYVATDPSSGIANDFTLSPDDFGVTLSLGGEFPIGSQTAIRGEARYNAGVLSANRTREAAFLVGLSYRF